MSNFVTDNTTLSFPKVDLNPVGTGDPTKFIAAQEWNALCQAAYDLRGATPKYTAGDPNGALAGAKGDIARDTTNGKIWVNTTGATTWKPVPITNTAPTPGTYGPGVTATVDAQGLITELATAAIPGRMLAAPTTLTGSGSGTLPAGTCVVVLEMIGQGGGGGGAVNGSAAASGGLTGWRFRITIGTPGTPLGNLNYSWTAGSAAGGGGSAAGGNGTAGSDTTASFNGTGYTAKGGAGGIGSTGSAAVGSTPTPTALAGTSSGGIATYGRSGAGQVMALATAGLVGGAGGGTDLGAGGDPRYGSAGAGSAGSTAGFGGGGGGAVAINASGSAGGAGAPGCLIFTPYS